MPAVLEVLQDLEEQLIIDNINKMKLLRIGDKGNEKPAVLDKDGKIRDLSSEVNDFTPENLNNSIINLKIKNHHKPSYRLKFLYYINTIFR